jgi:hypothetical protein
LIMLGLLATFGPLLMRAPKIDKRVKQSVVNNTSA